MTEISDSSKQPCWRAALARLDGAYADTTLRAYRTDMGIFEEWCQAKLIEPLPASPLTIADFIADQAKHCSAATLKRRMAAIRKIHRLLRMENPVTDEEVVIAMRRALRTKSARPHQALGLTRQLRDRLIKACPDTLAGLRDRALIALGYDTLCRRSELVALRVEDLAPSSGGGRKILIRRSKSDQFGQGRLGYISPETSTLLYCWLERARIEEGYIFPSINRKGIAKDALHPFSVNRILKNAATAAKLSEHEVKELSGHSMRVGAAQDMMSSGLGILPIMQAGGWKTINVVARYVENADLKAIMQRDAHHISSSNKPTP